MKSLLFLLLLAASAAAAFDGTGIPPLRTLSIQATALHAREAQDLRPLQERRRAALSHAEALAVQRRIEDRKRLTELQILATQAELARASRATALADTIDAKIELLQERWALTPDSPLVPSIPEEDR